ncbi:hypothetical protein WJX73_004508 [Symbiochloris irregularis]|uniref:Protein kinase domain-containing protein n=1 Tax=Symbiochloris irregularis TaxID=706552 RepID=A0AAW1PPS3_9CHLO
MELQTHDLADIDLFDYSNAISKRHLPAGTGLGESLQILQIPRDFTPTPGTKLAEGLFVGTHIAHGLQARVYELVDSLGHPTNVVVKVVHRLALLAEVEREWEKAQCWLGFHHSDLRLANVMEILLQAPSPGSSPRQATPTEKTLEARVTLEDAQGEGAAPDRYRYQFKLIDYGLALFDEVYACGPDLPDEDDPTAPLQMHAHVGGSAVGLEHALSAGGLLSQPSTSDIPKVSEKDAMPRLPRTSAIEKLYRYMWRRKGDVYHLLFDLGEWLDGRVWPKSDELDVLRLVALIHHVTGARLHAYFRDDNSEAVSGWQDMLNCSLFKRDGAALHFLRRWHVRLKTWVNPSNPGLTAAEALTAPFFTKHRSMRAIVRGGSARFATWTVPRSGADKKRNLR